MPYEVELENVVGMPIAAVNAKATRPTLGKTITSSFDIVYAFLKRTGMRHLGLNMVVYLDSELNLEVGVRVQEPFESTDEVQCSVTPSGLAAHVVYFGSYDQMRGAYEALEAWSNTQEKKPIGPSWEAYGHWNDDPTQLRTDIYWLVSEN